MQQFPRVRVPSCAYNELFLSTVNLYRATQTCAYRLNPAPNILNQIHTLLSSHSYVDQHNKKLTNCHVGPPFMQHLSLTGRDFSGKIFPAVSSMYILSR